MAKQFLHERDDFKPLIDAVAQDQRINTPALVEKDYWLMHCLYGLQKSGLKFELKGGTSLSKGFGIIHRFSEDIDIRIEAFDDTKLYSGPNHDKPKHIESRKLFFERLKNKIKIPGIVQVERDTEYDDVDLRNAGFRLHYDSRYDSVEGLKNGVLLEVGFDQTNPNQIVDIGSWVTDFSQSKNMTFTDNRAMGVPCYNPEYTFVEKLQTVANKFRQYMESGKFPRNFLRHYYDLHQLLDEKRVQDFIGTDEYYAHKKKRFKGLDQNVAATDAFKLEDVEIRKYFAAQYAKTASLYYRGQVPLEQILKRIGVDLARL